MDSQGMRNQREFLADRHLICAGQARSYIAAP